MLFNFTKEFVYELDERMRKYDDLVRLTIKTDNSVVASQFELQALEKVVVKHGSTSYDDLSIQAQFTSTNRPYEIGDSIHLGTLRDLAHTYIRTDEFSAYRGFNDVPMDVRKQYVLDHAEDFRKHDTTVLDIIKDFHYALGLTFMRAAEFVKEHKLYTVGSYLSYQETNPDRLLMRDPKDSVTRNLALHVYHPSLNKTLTSFYRSSFPSMLSEQFNLEFNSYQYAKDEYLKYRDDMILTQKSSFYKHAITKGFAIKSTPYTERSDLDPAKLFASKNTQPKNLYVVIDGIVNLVPFVSLAGHKSEQDAIIAYIDNDHASKLLSTCNATGHYLVGRMDDYCESLPNYSIDLLKSIGYSAFTNMGRVTRAFNDAFMAKIDTSNSERCHRCTVSSIEIQGDLEGALALSEISSFRNNIREFISSRLLQNMVDFDGHKFCSSCHAHVLSTYNTYGGYFVDGYFISEELTVPEKRQILFAEHAQIQDYDYNPENLYDMSTNRDIPSLGVELEVDSEYEDDTDLDTEAAATMAQMIIARTDDHVYLMSDGSLSNGFEMATYPADVYQHMNPDLFNYEPAFRNIVRAGYRGHDAGSAGIHVHISRDFFGYNRSEQLYRASLMAYIMESNWDEFVKFSRRRYHHLEQWAKKKEAKYWYDQNSVKDQETMRESFVQEYDMDKYVAFNINHRHTFELRIFRSTLNYTTYLATLQFVHNFAMLAKRIDLGEAQLITFKDIIKEHSFDELNQYVAERFGSDYLN